MVILEHEWFTQEIYENIIDYKNPQVEDYGRRQLKNWKTVNYIVNEIIQGNFVIVQRTGGSGRTGTLLAAYFMKKEGFSAQQALPRVKEKRERAPGREKQQKILLDYEIYLFGKQKSHRSVSVELFDYLSSLAPADLPFTRYYTTMSNPSSANSQLVSSM